MAVVGIYYAKNIKKNIESSDFYFEPQKIDLLVPIIPKDFEKYLYNIEYYQRYLRFVNNIVFIGNEDIRKLIKENQSKSKINLLFINENELIDVRKIKNLIISINSGAGLRCGWYVQQFLKMQYSKICENEYYFIWDGDTIPLRDVHMFNDEGKPFFDVKFEFHKPYFDTMQKIFSDLNKKYDFSFISEHMIIKTNLMKELIDEIQSNQNIKGELWYEKIINAVDHSELPRSGFSEYETYGNFVQIRHPDSYEIRQWSSFRDWEKKYNHKNFSIEEAQELAKSYDAISFESK